MQTILILGARAPIALEMARSFSAFGCRVIMADSLKWTLARWSNSVEKYYRLSAPNTKLTKYILELKQIISKEQVTHLIPTCEEAFYISMYKNEFACTVWTANFNLMNQLHNKHDFIKLASTYFSVPKTISVDTFSDWANSKDYVFKPIYSRFATSVIINKNQEYCKRTIPQPDKWIAQERIHGKEICVYTVWNDGVLKAFAAYHPLMRIGKGSSIYFEPYFDEHLFEQIQTFGTAINYTGQLCFDFIVNENGAFVLECNPRGTSGAHLLHQKLAPAFLTNDSFILTSAKTFSIKAAILLTQPLSLFTKKFHRSSDVIIQYNDILPGLLQPLSLLEITYIKFKYNKTWLGATTGDIEWDGHEN
ncbi:ATP-grasp domain-containing protein [Cytophaga aurantiaca]|uniref:ATP-grasp domain-containing protein n=1 Tax=Cytophaga aurantiaca TaxID=29530 RepID=UPI0003A03966|nr:ATP-grasp domain-containing protein [Cytophaga aurantiaca]